MDRCEDFAIVFLEGQDKIRTDDKTNLFSGDRCGCGVIVQTFKKNDDIVFTNLYFGKLGWIHQILKQKRINTKTRPNLFNDRYLMNPLNLNPCYSFSIYERYARLNCLDFLFLKACFIVINDSNPNGFRWLFAKINKGSGGLPHLLLIFFK